MRYNWQDQGCFVAKGELAYKLRHFVQAWVPDTYTSPFRAIRAARYSPTLIPPDANAEFVACMEDVLEIYARPYDAAFPVVCMDEQPVQLTKETRAPIPATMAHPRRVDYE